MEEMLIILQMVGSIHRAMTNLCLIMQILINLYHKEEGLAPEKTMTNGIETLAEYDHLADQFDLQAIKEEEDVQDLMIVIMIVHRTLSFQSPKMIMIVPALMTVDNTEIALKDRIITDQLDQSMIDPDHMIDDLS